jgi:dipeptide/tripeptide permease
VCPERQPALLAVRPGPFGDQRGMVAVGWLLLGYLIQTLGELCLSPVGLSMVTKLSPMRLVSTVMGAWFLATACCSAASTSPGWSPAGSPC